MPTKRNNYKIDDEALTKAVSNAISIRQTLHILGLSDTGTAYRNIKRRIKFLNLDISHFVGKAYLKGKHNNWAPKQDMSNILIENSTYENISCLKNRLINENILIYKCSICGLSGVWNEKPLKLQLDHINGIYNDHRLENLRFLCPNCHSQTDTFAGKNVGANSENRTHTG